MERKNLLKVLGATLLVYVILTWIIPGGSYSNGTFVAGSTLPMGIVDIFASPINAIRDLMQYGLVFLLIGGFYGVLNATGAYGNIVNQIVSKMKGHEKFFLIVTIIVFALLSSLTGLSVPLFLLVPFFVAIILSMGYNRITALTTTVGSILVGMMASTYGFNISGYINNFLSIDVNEQIFTKIILFIILTFLFIMFVSSFIARKNVIKKDEKASKKETQKENMIEEHDIPLYEGYVDTKRNTVPLIVIGIFLVVLLFVGMYNWRYAFNVTLFENVYQSIMGIKIANYPIIQNIFGAISPIGYWGYHEMSFLLIVASLIIGWIYSVKFNTMFDSFVKGMKEMIPTATFVMLASIIFLPIVGNSNSQNIFFTISNWLFGLIKGFNPFTTALVAGTGSFFINDFGYLVQSMASPIQTFIADTTVYPIVGMIFQAMYGLVMLIAPTSMILLAGMAYTKVSFKEWIKHIWIYLLEALVIIVIIILIMWIFI